MINSRNKGNSYEVKIATELRPFFPDVMTSRYASKYTDNVLKSDFVNTGSLSIQAKCTENTPNLHKLIFEDMPQTGHNIVFNKKNRRGEVVSMSKETFYHILATLREHGEVFNKK
jgi:hypothetical protein